MQSPSNHIFTSASVGIDDLSVYIPKLYLPIADLAKARNIDPDKLRHGLGLIDMAVADAHEDAATLAANAVKQLIDQNELDPRRIGRIYLGTESALDGAKPTATYILEMLRRHYRAQYGPDCFLHCDVVDLTFACVGAVDALHNTVDWVRGDQNRIGIVVASDVAKYELASSGEYTQGAGAMALLVKHAPRLMVIGSTWGVGTRSVHDFFKPKKSVSKLQLVQEVLQLAGLKEMDAEKILAKLPETLEVHGLLDENDEAFSVRKDTPTFDGPYSNWCYQNRIREAFQHFRQQEEARGGMTESAQILDRWSRLIFHLPYAFHGKRMFSELFMLEKQRDGSWAVWAEANGLQEPDPADFDDKNAYNKAYEEFLRLITKTKDYQALIKERVDPSQWASSHVGNVYSCSIFLALASALERAAGQPEDMTGSMFGFFGYGSGSKSKVFEGVLQPEWRSIAAGIGIQQQLDCRTVIDYKTYENLHRGRTKTSVMAPENEFALHHISQQGNKTGARYYHFVPAEVEVAEAVIDAGGTPFHAQMK
ncbi:MAG: hydroxymethylglutaryl-CoA synthase family protein [Saprospiraceae bacterium]|nr:hydroxymethylglutaryl-CoA synthase family protein [Saprospiraceae bacterium]